MIAADGGPIAAWLVWTRRGARLTEIGAAFLLAALVICVLLQVISRYVLQSPITWTIDGATMAMIWVSFLGAAVGAFDRNHFAVEFIADALPPSLRRASAVFANLAAVALLILLVYVGIRFARLQFGQLYPSVAIAKGWAAAAIPIAAALMIPRYLVDAYSAVVSPAADARAREPA
jgi:TRAP-type transport system small permease protein